MLSDLFKGHGLDVAHYRHGVLFLKIHERHFLVISIWKKSISEGMGVFYSILYSRNLRFQLWKSYISRIFCQAL